MPTHPPKPSRTRGGPVRRKLALVLAAALAVLGASILTAPPAAAGTASINPTSINFGNVLVGTQSAHQTVTVTNTGDFFSSPLSISGVFLGGNSPNQYVKVADSCQNRTLFPQESCQVSVAFRPTTRAQTTATLQFIHNGAGSSTVSLSGRGTQPVASLSPAAHTFPDTTVGSQSGTQVMSMLNSGDASMVISSASIVGGNSGDFIKLLDLCTGKTVTPGSSCGVTVAFRPTSRGNKNASLQFVDSAPGSPHSAALSGRGVGPVLSVAPPSLDFGEVGTGTESALDVVVSNVGDAPMTVSAVALGGLWPGQYSVLDETCTDAPIPASATCLVTVDFHPTSVGPKPAQLRITGNAPGSPHIVELTGTGVGPDLVLSETDWLLFGPVDIGGDATRGLMISNNGPGVLDVQEIYVGGVHQSDFAYDSPFAGGCEGLLGPGDSCPLTATFTPQLEGVRSANLQFVSNDPDGLEVVGLSGSGRATADLNIKGPGTVYSDGNGNKVTLAVAPTAAGVFAVKVVNRATTSQVLEVDPSMLGDPATVKLTAAGSTIELPKDAGGNWVLPSIPAGGTKALSLRVDPTGAGQPTARVRLGLLAGNEAEHDRAFFDANTKAPTKGTDGFGLFVRAGSQPFVGGSVNGQVTTHPGLASGKSGKYTARVRNDGGSAGSISVKMAAQSNPCWTIAVTAPNGLSRIDITDQLLGNGYQTKVLNAGQYVDLQATVKRVANGCGAAQWTLTTLAGSTPMHHAGLLANAAVGTE